MAKRIVALKPCVTSCRSILPIYDADGDEKLQQAKLACLMEFDIHERSLWNPSTILGRLDDLIDHDIKDIASGQTLKAEREELRLMKSPPEEIMRDVKWGLEELNKQAPFARWRRDLMLTMMRIWEADAAAVGTLWDALKYEREAEFVAILSLKEDCHFVAASRSGSWGGDLHMAPAPDEPTAWRRLWKLRRDEWHWLRAERHEGADSEKYRALLGSAGALRERIENQVRAKEAQEERERGLDKTRTMLSKADAGDADSVKVLLQDKGWSEVAPILDPFARVKQLMVDHEKYDHWHRKMKGHPYLTGNAPEGPASNP